MPSSRRHKTAAGARGPLLESARDLYARQSWRQAHEAFAEADQASPLTSDDLECLARSAGLIGRNEEMLRALERLYHARLQAGETPAAVRAAFWLTMRLLSLGEPARAGGWLARGQRLLETDDRPCVERGFILIPTIGRQLGAGDLEAAGQGVAQAIAIGARFADPDLTAFARYLQGRVALKQGRMDEAINAFDEVLVAAGAGDLSPMVTGLLYCAVIARYAEVYALDRARELNTALARWCQTQPEVVTFNNTCQVHRSEMLQLSGDWPAALEEARRVSARSTPEEDPQGAAHAHYQQAEIHRLRGQLAEAEAAYRQASQLGLEAQPGLALLRLAQGDREAAASGIRRVVEGTADPLLRTRFLPAHVEIMLAIGQVEPARAACQQLQEAAATFRSEVLAALAGHARAALALAEGDARAALEPARAAFHVWQRIGAPYIAARLRVLLGRACLALGDADGACLELDAAREAFERLGAAPDLQALEALRPRSSAAKPPTGIHHGLTARELQVLRLIASGKTNRAIAGELSLSEKTVDRHVSNIFNKIDVSTRSAATAYAYQHDLV